MERRADPLPREDLQEFVKTLLSEYATSAAPRKVHGHPGTLFLVEGIDYAGKGTALCAIADELRLRGKRVFDASAYERAYDQYPSREVWVNADALIVEQPAYCLIGRRIRTVLINKQHAHRFTPHTVATEYACDRDQSDHIIVEPALREGKIVIEGRSLWTSMVYQPVQDWFYRETHATARLTVPDILALPGNAHELLMLPDAALITILPAHVAMARAASRDKQDDAAFEKLSFQEIIEPIYESAEVQGFFRSAGVRVHTCPTGGSVEETKRDVRRVFSEFLESRVKDKKTEHA